MSSSGRYVVNVEVAVVRGCEYLMIVRSEDEEHAAGALAFPGGKVDPEVVADDVLERTARREVLEEVSLTVGELRYLESKSFVADDGIFVVDVVFLAEAGAGEAVAGDPREVADIRWMSANEVLADPATPPWTARSVRLAEEARLGRAGEEARQGGAEPGRLALDHILLAMPPGQEERARTFYGALLGLPEIDKPEPLRSRGGVWFRLGAQELHLGAEEPFLPQKKAHPGLTCRELDALAAQLASAGHPVSWDTDRPGLRRFHTSDPFGNRLEFMEPNPPPR